MGLGVAQGLVFGWVLVLRWVRALSRLWRRFYVIRIHERVIVNVVSVYNVWRVAYASVADSEALGYFVR